MLHMPRDSVGNNIKTDRQMDHVYSKLRWWQFTLNNAQDREYCVLYIIISLVWKKERKQE